jgi:DNA-binding transcriptional ArsR family regulator
METMRKSRASVAEAEPIVVGTQLDSERCQVAGANQARVARGKRELLDEETAFEVAEIFRALSDSSRAKIIYSLLKQELCTCDLAAIIGSSESSVSQHLRILRQLRIVKSRRNGKQVFYSLDDTHIRILLLVCLNHVRDNGDRSQDLGKILDLFETDHTVQAH